jgi:hypothetical protein
MEHGQKTVDALHARRVLRASERAMGRAASVAHQDLKHGLNTLATITCLAPFVGVLGTVWALAFDTFLGLNGDLATGLGLVAGRISWACVPSALGIFVGLQSLWAYRYLRGRLDVFDCEMAQTSLDLVNQLALHFSRFRSASSIQGATHSLPYLEAYAPDLDADRGYERHVTVITVTLLFVVWGVQVAAYFDLNALRLASAMSAGIRSLAIMFCSSCLPAYAVWVDFLHRKSSGVAPIAAALCLVWCAVGLFDPALRF